MDTRVVLLQFAAALALMACAGGGKDSASRQEPGDVKGSNLVYKSLESRQCEGGGRTLAELRQELVAAGIEPLGSSCGHTGMAYAQVCGAPDGRIGLFEIRDADVSRARKAGFALLRKDLPQAHPGRC